MEEIKVNHKMNALRFPYLHNPRMEGVRAIMDARILAYEGISDQNLARIYQELKDLCPRDKVYKDDDPYLAGCDQVKKWIYGGGHITVQVAMKLTYLLDEQVRKQEHLYPVVTLLSFRSEDPLIVEVDSTYPRIGDYMGDFEITEVFVGPLPGTSVLFLLPPQEYTLWVGKSYPITRKG